MNFQGYINKIMVTTKKEGDVETDYVQLTILAPLRRDLNLTELMKYFREPSYFGIEASQVELNPV